VTIAAGRLRKQVTIQGVTRTPDGGGGYTETPVEIAEVWANVQPLDGREQLIAMQTGLQRPYRFTIRYLPDISSIHRVVYDGRTFDVKSVVDPEERHRELELLAEEVI
jgi:SPP1 family predicted phage head-tail adaptor